MLASMIFAVLFACGSAQDPSCAYITAQPQYMHPGVPQAAAEQKCRGNCAQPGYNCEMIANYYPTICTCGTSPSTPPPTPAPTTPTPGVCNNVAYHQCGGSDGYTGETCCPYYQGQQQVCHRESDQYYQCCPPDLRGCGAAFFAPYKNPDAVVPVVELAATSTPYSTPPPTPSNKLWSRDWIHRSGCVCVQPQPALTPADREFIRVYTSEAACMDTECKPPKVADIVITNNNENSNGVNPYSKIISKWSERIDNKTSKSEESTVSHKTTACGQSTLKVSVPPHGCKEVTLTCTEKGAQWQVSKCPKATTVAESTQQHRSIRGRVEQQ
jgi:hypothetical protein